MMGRPEQKWRTSEIHYRGDDMLVIADCASKKAQTNLLLYVVERVGRVDSEADQDDVRVWVGERS